MRRPLEPWLLVRRFGPGHIFTLYVPWGYFEMLGWRIRWHHHRWARSAK